MKIVLRPVFACAMALTLVACGESATPKADPKGQAAGEILPASVSDDMIPYDTLRSQPPLARQSDESEDGAGAASDAPASGPAPVE